MAAPTTACPPGHPPCRFTTTRRRLVRSARVICNLRSTSSGGPLVMLYRHHNYTAWQLPRPPAPPGILPAGSRPHGDVWSALLGLSAISAPSSSGGPLVMLYRQHNYTAWQLPRPPAPPGILPAGSRPHGDVWSALLGLSAISAFNFLWRSVSHALSKNSTIIQHGSSHDRLPPRASSLQVHDHTATFGPLC
jgi:hypothetical protein